MSISTSTMTAIALAAGLGLAGGYGLARYTAASDAVVALPPAQTSAEPAKATMPIPSPVGLGEPVIRMVSGDEKITSNTGVLVIRPVDQDGSRLLFEGKPVAGSSDALDQLADVLAVVEWSDRSAFLIASNCGGSGCPQNSYFILLTTKAGDVRLLSIEKIAQNLEAENLMIVNRHLWIDFGFQSKQRTIVQFDGNTLQLHRTTLQNAALKESSCQWLHEAALPDCQRDVNDCEDTPSSGFASRGYAFIEADQPGFNDENFKKLCLSICKKRQKIPSYSEFKRLVCEPMPMLAQTR